MTGKMRRFWVVWLLLVLVLAASQVPGALTSLVEMKSVVGGPVDLVPPACLHPGRGVLEDVHLVMRGAVARHRAHLKLAAQVALLKAGEGQGGTRDTSPGLPLPAALPNSPEVQRVGGVASGAEGWPGAVEKLVGVAFLPARDSMGCDGACGTGQWLEAPASQTPSHAWREQWCGCCLLAVLLKWGIRAAAPATLTPNPLCSPSPVNPLWLVPFAPAPAPCQRGFTIFTPSLWFWVSISISLRELPRSYRPRIIH